MSTNNMFSLRNKTNIMWIPLLSVAMTSVKSKDKGREKNRMNNQQWTVLTP